MNISRQACNHIRQIIRAIGAGRACAVAIAMVLAVAQSVAQPASAQPASAADASLPDGTSSLGNYLNPDGTLRFDRPYSGNIDTHGWGMTLDASGAPRFVPLAMPADSTGDTLRDVAGSIEGDAGWDSRFGPPGPNGIVYAIAVLGDEVYFGGRFNVIGRLRANSIAAWNRRTHQWTSLAGGIAGEVRAMAVANGALYVGGVFTAAASLAANGVAKWDPATRTWSTFGNGVQLVIASVARGGDVYAIAVHGDEVYIAGIFAAVDDPGTQNLAVWDGTKWGPIDRARLPNNAPMYALAVRGDDLFIGGSFTRMGKVDLPYLAQWNIPSRAWSSPGGGVSGVVHSILADGQDLYVGGAFTKAGTVPAVGLARWDGAAWHTLGRGIDGVVYSLAMEGTDLYVGGTFTTAAGLPTNGIAKWNGGSWSMMGVGMALTPNGESQWDNTVPTAPLMSAVDEGPQRVPYVGALAAVDGEVYAGGSFTSAGSVTTHHIAHWDGARWGTIASDSSPVINYNGTDGAVYAMAMDGDNIYIGGDFTTVAGLDARRVAQWNRVTNRWSALGRGIDSVTSVVRAMVMHGSDLYVGGIFQSVSGITANGLARWSGSAWSTLGDGVHGNNQYVFALAMRGNELYVGGSFTRVGFVNTNAIARYNFTSFTWLGLDAGMNNETNSAYVTTIVADGNDLLIGGGFSRAGTVQANNIARWNGSAWSTLGPGIFNGTDAPVHAIAVGSGGKIYAGGEFLSAGGHSAPYLATWDGASWSALPQSPSGPVLSMLSVGSNLYIGGEFTSVGGLQASHVARWNGTSWSTTGSAYRQGAVNGFVRVLAAADTEIYAGGEFSIVDGNYARNIALLAGNTWSSLGADPQNGGYGIITAIAVHDTDVYVGGAFGAIGGMRTGSLARWDGNRWFAVGPELNGTVRALAIDDHGGVYAGGEFTKAGALAVKGLAYWDGFQWSALGAGIDGALPYVYALTIANGGLYAGGAFSTADFFRTNHVARWDLTRKVWQPLAGGVSGASYFTYVTALAASGNDIYVGGVFPTAGTIKSENVARWDGTAWNAVGGGVNNAVYSMAIDRGGNLLVGGDFRATADQGIKYMASWNGTRWSPFPGVFRGPVTMIAVSDQDVFVSGAFLYVSDVQTVGLARYDGHAWRNVGRGPAKDHTLGTIYAMAAIGNDLYVGGDFSTAGGIPSYYFAHWSRTEAASVETAPRDDAHDARAFADVVPNPCSTGADVHFTMSRRAQATVAIFDATGKEVATLASGTLEAGEHVLRWEPDDLPSGVYYCRLSSNGHVAATKIILLGGAR